IHRNAGYEGQRSGTVVGARDTVELKPDWAPKNDWFKHPPGPPTTDLEWNTCQVIDDQHEYPWFNDMVSATKDPLIFDELMATPIDFPSLR
nr:hypothetical protein [Tanacetum cinerariifolium]